MTIPTILIFDLLGVFVFALSGALAAARKDMDIFGYVVLALLPAIGGGTVRDLILNTSVFWIDQSIYVVVAAIAGVLVFFFSVRVGQRYNVLKWADALGLSLFCVMGASKAYAMTSDPVIAVTLGVVTAVVGGILRDVVCNEIPLILKREIYAIAAITGSTVYCIASALALPELWSLFIGGVCAFTVRALAIIYHWSLPTGR
ncbi:trimeric intracellular cation channel family protein [Arenicella xantha]|uniref:Putative membrane protein YeiH n=1 Tax=Arenicella xantha TaxID=644221 RepID=A0A395JGC0_9GAMM|nr:trimeric intracellular cation channel family protein [Arenicella xantha]RBP48781.1 putative membrane protein YeiH [Arenicella xantha]